MSLFYFCLGLPVGFSLQASGYPGRTPVIAKQLEKLHIDTAKGLATIGGSTVYNWMIEIAQRAPEISTLNRTLISSTGRIIL